MVKLPVCALFKQDLVLTSGLVILSYTILFTSRRCIMFSLLSCVMLENVCIRPVFQRDIFERELALGHPISAVAFLCF